MHQFINLRLGAEQLNIGKGRFKIALFFLSGFMSICSRFKPSVCLKQKLNAHITLFRLLILDDAQAMRHPPSTNRHESS